MLTVLAGGVGAARFLRGLVQVVDPAEITVIVNVGDDMERYGLLVSPDLDSITYWLAGVIHPEQQWGRADESFVVATELERFGEDRWFTLGDRDLATHVFRTKRRREGASLSSVTAEITRAFDLDITLLPATDDPVATRVHTEDGRDLHFQEWWVGERAGPGVARVELRGADTARPAPGVIEAIIDADAVLIAPSNPIVSIGTILDVPGIAAALRTTPAPIVGVSPIIGGAVVRGMADTLLVAAGTDVSAAGVAGLYAPWLGGWVIDDVDAPLASGLRADGLAVAVTNTLLDDADVAADVARACLALAEELR